MTESYRRPHRMRVPVLLLTLLILVPTVAVGAWKPVKPAGAAERFRLVAVDDAGGREAIGGIWTLLEPGAELGFAVPGTGAARVETVPFYTRRTDPDRYRFSVVRGDSVRRFARRSPLAGRHVLTDVGGAERSGLLGETDRLEIRLAPGSEPLRVVSREAARPILVRVLLDEAARSVVAVGRAAATPSSIFSLAADVPRLGWDGNAYLTPKTAVPVESKWFLPVEFTGRWRSAASGTVRLDAAYAFRGRFYDEPMLDETRHRARFGVEWKPGARRAGRRWDLDLEYRLTRQDDTFSGRNDRDEFETTDLATGRPVSLADRFDYLEHRVRLRLARELGRNTRAGLTVTAGRRDYRRDYSELPDTYSLDQDRHEVGISLERDAGRDWTVAVAARLGERNYDEKFSRDVAGGEVVSTPSRLRRHSLRLSAERAPRTGLQLSAGIRLHSGTDRYAGYWDYAGTAWELGGGWRWARGHRVAASIRYSQRDYDRARIDHDPLQPLREKSALVLRLKGRRELNEAWSVEADWRRRDADNNNPTFAYERSLVTVGLAYRR